jgi:hypothetical protein
MNLVKQRKSTRPRFPPRDPQVPHNRLGDLVANWNVRCEGRHRVLKDRSNPRTAHAIEALPVLRKQIAPIKQRAAAHPTIASEQAEDREQRLTLAGTRFPNYGNTLSSADFEPEILYRGDLPLRCAEPDVQILQP